MPYCRLDPSATRLPFSPLLPSLIPSPLYPLSQIWLPSSKRRGTWAASPPPSSSCCCCSCCGCTPSPSPPSSWPCDQSMPLRRCSDSCGRHHPGKNMARGCTGRGEGTVPSFHPRVSARVTSRGMDVDNTPYPSWARSLCVHAHFMVKCTCVSSSHSLSPLSCPFAISIYFCFLRFIPFSCGRLSSHQAVQQRVAAQLLAVYILREVR